ncbi:hypothetical protein CA606_18225 [Caulobacter vibrioides]|uniref:Uncharacterized protein n=1 Tax=Caulobacter vibrioides TaxID=155892 RepID=A0A290MQ23_CAUVI|nr:hypothetical protein [Caulobacter vibrioides]ATC34111.1 hypothetical protein CA606_18225 [Caulobacter vibrioides]
MPTFPLAMPSKGPGAITFEPRRVDRLSPTSGARVSSVASGWPLWYGKYTLGKGLGAPGSDEWRAFVNRLDGPGRYFLGRDYRRPYPLAYLETQLAGLARAAGGAFDGAASTWSRATSSENEPQLVLSGLPANMVLSLGDYVGFRWTTGGEDRRALVRVQAAAQATGEGWAELIVRPAVHLIVPPGAVAHFDNPACLMKLIPGETELGDVDRSGSISGVVAGIQDLAS